MLSAAIEYKAFDESPLRLRELEEARGQLLKILDSEGQAVAAFKWGAISLPLDLRDELAGMVGRKIAILRLGGRYYIRGLDSD
jgi:hypothetical protein